MCSSDFLSFCLCVIVTMMSLCHQQIVYCLMSPAAMLALVIAILQYRLLKKKFS